MPRPAASRPAPIDIEADTPALKRRLIIGLTWPALAENLLASLVSMVDMMMVAGLGAYAINAVGLVTQPRFVLLASFMALNVGTTAMISRFKGARDPDNANVVMNQALLMTLGVTAALCAAMLLGGEALVRFLAGGGIAETTIREALAYLRIQVYGFPALSLTFTINAALRGVGNTRASFYNNTVSNVVNVFFNYCLIGGRLGFPALGVAGASLATVIGQAAALAMAVSKILGGKEFVQLVPRRLRLDLPMARRVLHIGLPALAEQLIMRVGMMLFTIIVTSLGDFSYAAHMVAMNIQQLSFSTGMSFGVAATTLMGQCLGRGRADLARVYVRMTQRLSLVVSTAVALLLFFGGAAIASLYFRGGGAAARSGADMEMIALAAVMLRIIAVVNPVSNARFVYVSALRGAGDSRFAAVITFVGVLVVRPLISLVLVLPQLPFHIGLAGVWIALSSDGVVCYALARARYLRGRWETIRV